MSTPHRDIRFRVWDPTFNRYLLGDEQALLFTSRANPIILEPVCPCGTTEPLPYVIEQATGMEDKNGVDVFEGDIVRYTWARDEHDYETDIGEVFWDSGGSAFLVDRSNEFGWRDCNFLEKTVEVLGNIHQNPDLLKT